MRVFASLLILTFLTLMPLRAALVLDYFDYGSTDGDLVNLTTTQTAGWDGNAWAGASAIKYSATESLTYGGSGYTDNSNGGLLNADGSAGDSVVTRNLAAGETDDVFVSFLMQGEFFNASTSRLASRLLINGDANNSAGVISNAGDGVTDSLFVNGAETQNIAGFGSGDRTVLVVVKLETNFSGNNDRISLWSFLNDDLSAQTEAALGVPSLISDGTADLWGSDVNSFGIALQSPNTTTREVFFDNLRISSGPITNDAKVQEILTGVAIPEPSSALLTAGAMVILLSRRQRRGVQRN